MGADDASRQSACRALFEQVLSDKTLTDIRLALNQTQPLGNNRFFDAIEQATGERRETKPRGRPRKPALDVAPDHNPNQLGLSGMDA